MVLITDNISSAYALSTGRTKDTVLSSCAREMWLQAASSDHDVQFVHKPGTEIPLADALSRMHEDSIKATYARRCIDRAGLSKCSSNIRGLKFLSIYL